MFYAVAYIGNILPVKHLIDLPIYAYGDPVVDISFNFTELRC